MEKKTELEQSLYDARKEQGRNYDLRNFFSNNINTLDEDMDERIRRIDQYLSSKSMSEKDKLAYAEKRLTARKRHMDFEDQMDDLRKRIAKQCEESDYKVSKLENMVREMSENDE
ncbi:MAG: hypothetical protein NC393_05915 [Clostridium sp.]|nr:hypothetical protein [Clostridium sp.]MCM1171650.1 hypothetical protein [Clostridium sp.]